MCRYTHLHNQLLSQLSSHSTAVKLAGHSASHAGALRHLGRYRLRSCTTHGYVPGTSSLNGTRNSKKGHVMSVSLVLDEIANEGATLRQLVGRDVHVEKLAATLFDLPAMMQPKTDESASRAALRLSAEHRAQRTACASHV